MKKAPAEGGSAGASDRRVGIRAARAPPLRSNFDRYRAVKPNRDRACNGTTPTPRVTSRDLGFLSTGPRGKMSIA